MLIFEESISTLWYSNDGRLRVEGIRPDSDDGVMTWLVHDLDTGTVFATHIRLLADAYIAGYDRAVDRADGVLDA